MSSGSIDPQAALSKKERAFLENGDTSEGYPRSRREARVQEKFRGLPGRVDQLASDIALMANSAHHEFGDDAWAAVWDDLAGVRQSEKADQDPPFEVHSLAAPEEDVPVSAFALGDKIGQLITPLLRKMDSVVARSDFVLGVVNAVCPPTPMPGDIPIQTLREYERFRDKMGELAAYRTRRWNRIKEAKEEAMEQGLRKRRFVDRLYQWTADVLNEDLANHPAMRRVRELWEDDDLHPADPFVRCLTGDVVREFVASENQGDPEQAWTVVKSMAEQDDVDPSTIVTVDRARRQLEEVPIALAEVGREVIEVEEDIQDMSWLGVEASEVVEEIARKGPPISSKEIAGAIADKTWDNLVTTLAKKLTSSERPERPVLRGDNTEWRLTGWGWAVAHRWDLYPEGHPEAE